MKQTAYYIFSPTIDPDVHTLNVEALGDLSRDTGLDVATLRNSIVGDGIGCVRRSMVLEQVEPVAEGFAANSWPFLYTSSDELDAVPVSHVRGIAVNDGHFVLDTPDGKVPVDFTTPMILAGSGKWDDGSMKRNLIKSDWFILATPERAFIVASDHVTVEGLSNLSRYSARHRCISFLEALVTRATDIATDSSFRSMGTILSGDRNTYAALLSLAAGNGLKGQELPRRFIDDAVADDAEITMKYKTYRGWELWKRTWFQRGHVGIFDGRVLLSVFVIMIIGAFELASLWLTVGAFGFVCLGGTYRFFKTLNLKRLVADMPTSKLRSVSAGFVEVTGRIHANRLFVSPISGARCVCFRYTKQRRIKTQDGHKWRTVEVGEAFPESCFLDDGTGIISMNLKNAELMLTTKYKTDHTYASMMAGIPSFGGSDTRYIEEYLQEGQTVYVMGTATPASPIRLFGEYVATVKRDRDVVERFDLNGDGKLDEMEWERAIPQLRRTFMEHMVKRGQSFGLIIDYHRDTPVFLVSNDPENHVISRLSWRIPVFLTVGLVSFVITTILLIKLVGR